VVGPGIRHITAWREPRGVFVILTAFDYVDRRLPLCRFKFGDEGLQSALPQYVLGSSVVLAEPSGDDGSLNIYLHENLPKRIDQKFPGVCALWVGAVQLFLPGLGDRHNFASGKRKPREACGRSSSNFPNIRRTLQLRSLERADWPPLSTSYRFWTRSERVLALASSNLGIGSHFRVRTGPDLFRDGRLHPRHAVCRGILQSRVVLAGANFLSVFNDSCTVPEYLSVQSGSGSGLGIPEYPP